MFSKEVNLWFWVFNDEFMIKLRMLLKIGNIGLLR